MNILQQTAESVDVIVERPKEGEGERLLKDENEKFVC